MSQLKEQNSVANIAELLHALRALQSQSAPPYPDGIFPSQRYHPILPYIREDDNLFFTVTIAYILQTLFGHFSASEKKLAQQIIDQAQASFHLFKNKDGLDTYNFWQTRPSRHFPNGLFMHRLRHFKIPDDVDDTALVFLVENASKARVNQLREKLQLHANLAYKTAFNPLPKYRQLKCYSTFFGDKMYIEFDLCVLSNLMHTILPHFKDDLNEYDHGTLSFIAEAVTQNEHFKHPFYSAPNYPTTELILYHVSRLIPHLPAQYKSRIEAPICEALQKQLPRAIGLNRILLENAALKLGVPFTAAKHTISALENDDTFFFFHAGMITAFENHIAQHFAAHPFFHLRYTSKALNRALLIENMVLKRALNTTP